MADDRTNRDDTTRRTDAPKDSNPDAITGAPGSHPIGTGVGAAAAGAAGAAIGSVVPGVGTAIGGAVGAVVGAVAGGLAGKGVAEAINPTAEDEYWRNEHRNRPYYTPGNDYDQDYAPAYRHGYTAASQNRGKRWEDVESNMASSWDRTKDRSRLSWDKAKNASRDAWDRVTNRDTVAGSTSGSSMGSTGSTSNYGGSTTGAGTAGSGVGFADPDVDNFTSTYRSRYTGRNFDDVEPDLRRDWESSGNRGSRTWESIKDSVRRGWHKVERAMPGDADRDGR